MSKRPLELKLVPFGEFQASAPVPSTRSSDPGAAALHSLPQSQLLLEETSEWQALCSKADSLSLTVAAQIEQSQALLRSSSEGPGAVKPRYENLHGAVSNVLGSAELHPEAANHALAATMAKLKAKFNFEHLHG